ncbi:MAG: hypothetical protein GY928_34145 [Colwellia sp.]|nr:hypothetical protein [Colwellia sp.]
MTKTIKQVQERVNELKKQLPELHSLDWGNLPQVEKRREFEMLADVLIDYELGHKSDYASFLESSVRRVKGCSNPETVAVLNGEIKALEWYLEGDNDRENSNND